MSRTLTVADAFPEGAFRDRAETRATTIPEAAPEIRSRDLPATRSPQHQESRDEPEI